MEEQLKNILQTHFDAPATLTPRTDLRQYLSDSIDVGELIAIINNDFNINLKLIDFREVFTLRELQDLVQNNVL